MWKNTRDSFGRVTRAIHWVMGVLIIFMILFGSWMADLNFSDPYFFPARQTHFAVGILLGVFLLLRVAWRLLDAPPQPIATKRWQVLAAKAVHYALYIVVAAVIVSGYLAVTARGRDIDVFGWFEVPALIVDSGGTLGRNARQFHHQIVHVLQALIVIHIAAALWHQFVYRDGTLWRMWSGRAKKG